MFLPYRALGREVAAKRARYSKANRGQQHHRAVHARGGRIVLLVMVAEAAQKKCDAQSKKQVRQDCADDRRAHHLKVTGLEHNERDDELRRIAEGGVEQTSYGIASAPGDLLGGLHDQRRDRHNGQRRGKKDHGRRHFASVLENDGDWNEREQPVKWRVSRDQDLVVAVQAL